MSNEKNIGYVAQVAATLSTDGVSLSVNFNMPESATKEDFGAKIDMLRQVVERQRAKGEVDLLRAELVAKEGMLRNQKLDLEQYLKRPKSRADDETAQRTQARIDDMTADITRGREKLEETIAKAV